jgi:hypothetical protein
MNITIGMSGLGGSEKAEDENLKLKFWKVKHLLGQGRSNHFK